MTCPRQAPVELHSSKSRPSERRPVYVTYRPVSKLFLLIVVYTYDCGLTFSTSLFRRACFADEASRCRAIFRAHKGSLPGDRVRPDEHIPRSGHVRPWLVSGPGTK